MEEEDPTTAAAADDVPPLIPDRGGDGASDKVAANNDNNNDEEDNAAMEAMMAFQEEQQLEEEVGGHVPTVVARRRENNINNNYDNDELLGVVDDAHDPNVAFLGNFDDDNNNHDDEGDDDCRDLFTLNHPNRHHPAALALRRRQQAAAAAANNNNNAPRGHYVGIENNYGGLLRKFRLSTLIRPLLRYVPLSMLAAIVLLHHTFRTRQQFYIVMTYLQTSKLSYVILGNAIIAFSVGLFGTVTSLFLDGGLRPNERDSIGENIRWDVTETCLALTIFRSELDAVTALQFLILVVMKCLHWSVELRGGHLRDVSSACHGWCYGGDTTSGQSGERSKGMMSRGLKDNHRIHFNMKEEKRLWWVAQEAK
jgi:hypothetical protein